MRIQEPCYAEPCLFILADESLVESVENASFGICPMDKAAEVVLQLILRWNKRAARDEERCSIGIEFISEHESGRRRENSLRACIERSLPEENSPLFARDLTAAIRSASRTSIVPQHRVLGGRPVAIEALAAGPTKGITHVVPHVLGVFAGTSHCR